MQTKIKSYEHPNEENIEQGDYIVYSDPEDKDFKVIFKFYEIIDYDRTRIYFVDDLGKTFGIKYAEAVVVKNNEESNELLVGEDIAFESGFETLEKILFASKMGNA